MTKRDHDRPTWRLLFLLPLVIGLGLSLACEDIEGDTIIVNGLDCGLIRDDLIGSWQVTYVVSGSVSLEDCTGLDPGLSGNITTGPGTAIYADVDVLGSDSSTSFKVLWLDLVTGLNTTVGDLTGSIQADSCLAIIRTWEDDDDAYIQCIGTFDPVTGTILGVCDSAEVDTNGDELPDTSCSLGANFEVVVHIF